MERKRNRTVVETYHTCDVCGNEGAHPCLCGIDFCDKCQKVDFMNHCPSCEAILKTYAERFDDLSRRDDEGHDKLNEQTCAEKQAIWDEIRVACKAAKEPTHAPD